MRIGRMDKRITFWTITTSTDSYGAVTEVRSVFAVVWANIKPLMPKEYLAAKQTESAVTHEIRIRYLSGLTPQMVATHSGREFTVDGVIDVNEGHQEMIVMATEVV